MKVHVLEVKFSSHGQEEALYPVILRTDTEAVLVDCGYEGFMPLLEQAARHHSISMQQLTGILITHHDIDHIGALDEIKKQYPSIKICAPDIEEKYINGKRKSLRLQQAEDIFASLAEDQKPGALYFQEMLKSIKPVEVDATFPVEADLYLMPDIRVIHTPGHMPGHISLYLKESKTLISADALVYEAGELNIANPHFTIDLPQAVASVKKLQQLDIDRIICYHGGIAEGNIRQQLDSLIARYSTS